MIVLCFGVAIFWYFILAPADEADLLAPMIFGAFICLSMGGFFFRSFIPERFTDNALVHTWLQSHFIWHLFVIANGYLNYWAIYRAIVIHEQKYPI